MILFITWGRFHQHVDLVFFFNITCTPNEVRSAVCPHVQLVLHSLGDGWRWGRSKHATVSSARRHLDPMKEFDANTQVAISLPRSCCDPHPRDVFPTVCSCQ